MTKFSRCCIIAFEGRDIMQQLIEVLKDIVPYILLIILSIYIEWL